MAGASSSGLEWLGWGEKHVNVALSHHSSRSKLEGRGFDLSCIALPLKPVRTQTVFLTYPSLGFSGERVLQSHPEGFPQSSILQRLCAPSVYQNQLHTLNISVNIFLKHTL